jgi:tRNA modification GTPase
MLFQDTIAAIATANGTGALGIIRVSGTDAFTKVNAVFKGKNLTTVASHTVHYGHILAADQTEIDEVMVAVFKAPKTFTTEDLVEIFCHGSTFIQQKILDVLLQNGVRIATAGEFTQRAFLGGRIDLSQAEAVADLIAAENNASHQIALNQMKGGFSHELQNLREELINCTALIELELDFSEEDVDFVSHDHIVNLIDKIINNIHPLLASFAYGNAIKSGIPVALVGKPNAGKSSLLNVLLNENRAIVSAIAGTTRDTIEEQMTINGLQFRFIDTAGIRETQDEIETLGIQKTFEKAQQSAIIIYLFDKAETTVAEIVNDYHTLKNPENVVILCPTKIDLYPNYNWENIISQLKEQLGTIQILGISTKNNTNIETLKNALAEPYELLKAQHGNLVVVNQRHYQELLLAKNALQEAKEGFAQGLSGDLLSLHLREAIRSIGNITGAVEVDRDILGTIFGKFCIGK